MKKMRKKEIVSINELYNSLKAASTKNYIDIYGKEGKVRKYYKEVFDDVLIVINQLNKLNLKKGDRVGLLGTSCYEYILLDLACVFMKICSVPLDPERFADSTTLIDEFKLSMVFTNLEIDTENRFAIKKFEDVCFGEKINLFFPEAYVGDEVFTITFSSGTNGKPKGSQVHVKCFADQLSEAVNMFEIFEDDKMLVFLPMHIYLERCYIYLAILRGFNLVIAEPNYIIKVLKYDEITFTVGVPYFFEMMMELFITKIMTVKKLKEAYHCWQIGDHKNIELLSHSFKTFWGSRARFFLTGSAPCKIKVLKFYSDMGVPLYEGYGMSEIAGMIALNYPGNVKLGSVGKIFPNKNIRFDENKQIIVNSEFICNTGYFNEASNVVHDVFIKKNHIATGDIGYIDKEGYLYLTGRVDDVITLSNGKKVFPQDIETKINTYHTVTNSVVFGNDQGELEAIIALKDEKCDIRQLIKEVNESQPKEERLNKYEVFKMPFTVENKMLTRNFKLNRKYIKSKFGKFTSTNY